MMETDFSEIIETITNANNSLSEKLAQIEESLRKGLSDSQSAMDLIRQAVASLTGTIEEKMAAAAKTTWAPPHRPRARSSRRYRSK